MVTTGRGRTVAGKRQSRQSRDEQRTVLVGTGRAILREEGMGTGAETLTFKRVFERVEKENGIRLTNASIIRRVWVNQADFQTDVLVAIAADEGFSEFDQTMAALSPVLVDMDLSTPEARWSALLAGYESLTTISSRPTWRSPASWDSGSGHP